MKWNCDTVMRVRKVLTGAPSLRRAALRKAMKEKHTRRPKVARTGGRGKEEGREGGGREEREGKKKRYRSSKARIEDRENTYQCIVK